ncbi:MAG: ABC transporter transmembrane domain-containing protein [Dysgonamonadaceae bacterium]|nr:ABC transporter transmembrane domain-containing protein [Dysgonamonadaceae bacterium]
MNYSLNKPTKRIKGRRKMFVSLRNLLSIISAERSKLTIAFVAILFNAGLSLTGPYILGYTIDAHVQTKNYQGVLLFAGILLLIYVCAYILNNVQIRMMGSIGQRLLFRVRNTVFEKLQELPFDFFNQNKSGDLISRINNDTDKLNQFFSQSLMQFISSLIMMTGAGVFLLSINLTLGLATLTPTIILLIITTSISPWIRRKNEATLKSLGNMSAEIQEGLANFKVIVSFNRRDYFRKRLGEVNRENYKISIKAGIANSQNSYPNTFYIVVILKFIIKFVFGYFVSVLLICSKTFSRALLLLLFDKG